MKQLTIFSFLLFFYSTVYAGGFQVNLQGQRATGMGHCGIALTQNPSSIFFNPGAFGMLDSNHISLGGSFIIARTSYLQPTPGIYTSATVPQLGTPFTFYGSFHPKHSEKWNVGLGVYTPFGSGIAYPDDWLGQMVLQEMSLKAIFIQPTLAYKFNDKLSIGVGGIFATGAFLLRKALPVQFQDLSYGEAKLTGNAIGYGYNVGIYFQPSEKIGFGLTYRSGVSVGTDKGKAEFTVPTSLAEYFPNTDFSTKISLPGVLNLGVSWHISEKHLVTADVNYVGWSAYDTLSFDFTTNTDKLADMHSPRMYKNSVIFRGGYEYAMSDKLQLRGGAYFDITPVKDDYITPETPDSDKVGITAGLSYSPSSKLTIEVSFLYVEEMKRTAINVETNFGGTWKSRAFIPGVGVNYNF